MWTRGTLLEASFFLSSLHFLSVCYNHFTLCTVSPSTLLPLQLGFSHLQDQRQHEHIQEENLTQRCTLFSSSFSLSKFPTLFYFPFFVKLWICVQNSNFSFLSELDLVFFWEDTPGSLEFLKRYGFCASNFVELVSFFWVHILWYV